MPGVAPAGERPETHQALGGKVDERLVGEPELGIPRSVVEIHPESLTGAHSLAHRPVEDPVAAAALRLRAQGAMAAAVSRSVSSWPLSGASATPMLTPT